MLFANLASTYVVAMSRLDYETATTMSTHRAVTDSLFVKIAPIRGRPSWKVGETITYFQQHERPMTCMFRKMAYE